MRMNIVIVVILIGCAALFAQPYGTVGDTPIDDLFLQTLQFVHPEFSFTPDSAEFTAKLQKSFIYNHAFAEEARKAGLDKTPEAKEFIERIERLITDAYLAQKFEKDLSSKQVSVTEKEALNYYNNNLSQFTEPGVYSFLQAYVADTSEETIKNVKELLKKYSKIGETLDQFKMGAEGIYSMNYEKDLTLNSSHRFYKFLRDANIGQIIGPIQMDVQQVYLVLLSRIPEKVKNFEEVKKVCLQNVANEKASKAQEEMRYKAIKEYPVKLNKSFFSDFK